MTEQDVFTSLDVALKNILNRCKVLQASLDRPPTIGISGGSASGKSTLAKGIMDGLSNKPDRLDTPSLLAMDNYYYSKAHRSEHGMSGFDEPEVFNLPLFREHLQELVRGHDIYSPVYTYGGDTEEGMLYVEAGSILIADGLFTLSPKLGFDFDLSIFVETPKQEMLLRRLARDVERTGQTLAEIGRMFVEEVYPAYEEYVLPCAEHADIVIHNDWTGSKKISYSEEVREWILRLADL